MHGGTTTASFGLASILLVACFPDYAVGAGGTDAAARDSSTDGSMSGPDTSTDASMDASDGGVLGDSGDATSSAEGGPNPDAGDAGPLPVVPSCGDMSGLQANAPWPMQGYCPTGRRRGPLPGPSQQPSVHWQKAVNVDSAFAPLVMADGTVLSISTTDSKLWAYDADGNHRWTYSPPMPDTIQWGPALGSDGIIYVPCTSHIYGVDAAGAQVWQSDTDATRSNLVVGPGPLIYVTDATSQLVAYTANGHTKWTAALQSAVDYISPALGIVGSTPTLFQVTATGALWAVNAATGSASPLETVDSTVTAPTIFAPDGRLRISTSDTGRVWSVDTAGNVQWVWPDSDASLPGAARIPAVGDDSAVFVAHQGGEVVAIAADGGERWSTNTQPLCNAITLDAEGTVYTGCEDGLHAYDGATGSPAWSLSTPFASGLDYSISIGRGRMLYVNASDGTLYAVGP
jgi:hypothetical protein